MGLRINTNVASLTAQRHLTITSEQLGRSFARLASGKRIAVAADDAAGLGMSGRMTAEIRSIGVARRNLLDGMSLVQVADGVLDELTGIVQRVRELAMQASNGTLTDGDRSILDTEREQLADEATRVVSDATFNGNVLFQTGTVILTTMRIQAGTSADDSIEIELPDIARAALALEALPLTDADASRQTLRILDIVLDIVAEGRGQLGATQRRLESAGRSIAIQEESLSAARSRIVDLDYAVEVANNARLSVLQQAGVAVLAQANVQPVLALPLLSTGGIAGAVQSEAQ